MWIVYQIQPNTNTDVRITDKDIKTAIITVFYMFKKLSRDLENILKDPNLLQMKNTISEIKNTLNGINGRVNTKEKIN